MAPSGSLRRADAVAPQNLKMVQSLLPMLHRLPFRNHVLQRQIEQLQRRFLAGKRTTVLNDLPQTPMQRFHGVGGIDHLPYFGRKRKERNRSLPVLLPQLADRSVFVTPLSDKAVQFPLRFRRRRCPVDGFQIRHYLSRRGSSIPSVPTARTWPLRWRSSTAPAHLCAPPSPPQWPHTRPGFLPARRAASSRTGRPGTQSRIPLPAHGSATPSPLPSRPP